MSNGLAGAARTLEAPPLVLPLRECLTDCQVNRGLDPIFCQEECAHLTPGDVGPCISFIGCFVGGFELPSAPEIGAVFRPVTTTLLLVIAAIVGILLLVER